MEKEVNKVLFTKPKNGLFFKQLENVDKFKSSKTGDGYEIVTIYKVDPVTHAEVKQVKSVHLWALIQENEGTCSLDFILGEMAKGNMEVLERTDGKFMDTTKLPKNIYELTDYEAKTLAFYNKDPYIKRLYKTPGDYRKALSANVDIEKQIIDLYRKDMFDMQLAAAKKNGVDAPKGENK